VQEGGRRRRLPESSSDPETLLSAATERTNHPTDGRHHVLSSGCTRPRPAPIRFGIRTRSRRPRSPHPRRDPILDACCEHRSHACSRPARAAPRTWPRQPIRGPARSARRPRTGECHRGSASNNTDSARAPLAAGDRSIRTPYRVEPTPLGGLEPRVRVDSAVRLARCARDRAPRRSAGETRGPRPAQRAQRGARARSTRQKQKAREGIPLGLFGNKSRRRPTLPHGYPCSTIGSEELNFRVRDGIGCGLFEIITGNPWVACEQALERERSSAYAPNSVILNALQRVGLGVRNPNPARDLVFNLVSTCRFISGRHRHTQGSQCLP
jgi:hypothetical protein